MSSGVKTFCDEKSFLILFLNNEGNQCDRNEFGRISIAERFVGSQKSDNSISILSRSRSERNSRIGHSSTGDNNSTAASTNIIGEIRFNAGEKPKRFERENFGFVFLFCSIGSTKTDAIGLFDDFRSTTDVPFERLKNKADDRLTLIFHFLELRFFWSKLFRGREERRNLATTFIFRSKTNRCPAQRKPSSKANWDRVESSFSPRKTIPTRTKRRRFLETILCHWVRSRNSFERFPSAKRFISFRRTVRMAQHRASSRLSSNRELLSESLSDRPTQSEIDRVELCSSERHKSICFSSDALRFPRRNLFRFAVRIDELSSRRIFERNSWRNENHRTTIKLVSLRLEVFSFDFNLEEKSSLEIYSTDRNRIGTLKLHKSREETSCLAGSIVSAFKFVENLRETFAATEQTLRLRSQREFVVDRARAQIRPSFLDEIRQVFSVQRRSFLFAQNWPVRRRRKFLEVFLWARRFEIERDRVDWRQWSRFARLDFDRTDFRQKRFALQVFLFVFEIDASRTIRRARFLRADRRKNRIFRARRAAEEPFWKRENRKFLVRLAAKEKFWSRKKPWTRKFRSELDSFDISRSSLRRWTLSILLFLGFRLFEIEDFSVSLLRSGSFSSSLWNW